MTAIDLERLAVTLAGGLIALGIWLVCGWLWRRWRHRYRHRH
jgi:hypothetical protein